MLNKKKLLIILISTIFLLTMMESSFATDNQTDIASINQDSDKVTSSNDYYFDSSASDEGTGSENSPYKEFNNNIRSNSVNHLKNGEYHFQNNFEGSDISFIGEDVDRTIINCGGNSLNISRNLKLINITIKDFTIINEGSLEAENTIFDGGYGKTHDDYGNTYGGAIYTPYESKNYKVNINNCTFKDCYAEYGGAIYMDGGELNIVNSSFINNIAYNYGGAIACEYDSKININRTIFINDKSINDAGGAIYIKSSNLNARNIEIINSTATFGAAITSLNSKIELYKLIAENNTSKYEGGVIYQLYGTFSMQQSKLTNNSARNGGALFIDNVSSILIPNNIFENNTAELTAGAYYILASPQINFLNKFTNNKAQFYNDTYETPIYDNLNIGNGDYELILDTNTTFDGELPSYYSLIDKGFISSIKDQKYGGNCWAFSTLASLESCILKATGKEYDLSEENMKNLIELYSDYGLKLDTNDGGYILTGIGYLVSWLGPINEINDTYDDFSVLSPLLNSIMHVQNVLLLKRDNYTDNQAIKEAIIKYGAVGTGISYSADYLNKNTNAYYCPYGSINHAVAIVGWDDNYSKNNFRGNVENDGAWIVKNSWGSDWGNNGYFYVSYYDYSLAKVGQLGSSFTFILNDSIRYDKNYQYDVCGMTNYFASNENGIWYQNIFTATANESLAAVSTYFEKESNWTVSIFVEDILKLTKTGTSQAGYYTINLGQLIPLNMGDTFKILFQVTSNDYTRLPISEKYEANKFLSKEGISYFSYDGITWNDLYTSSSPSVACIKAFTLLNKLNSTISLNVNYNQFNPVEIIATITDEYGRIIQEGNVTFKLDNQNFIIPIENGIAKLTHNFTNSGLNNITAIFNSIPYNTCNDTYEFDLMKTLLNLEIILNQDKNNVDIAFNLSENINSKIKVLINNNETIIDLINGYCNLRLNNLANGNYTLNAILEDSIYEATNNRIFQVNYQKPVPAKPVVTPIVKPKVVLTIKTTKTLSKRAKKLVLQATLKINGISSKNQKITFKFNGKTFTTKTNVKGVAKYTIKQSLLKRILKKVKVGKKVTYQVTYNAKTAKKTIKTSVKIKK